MLEKFVGALGMAYVSMSVPAVAQMNSYQTSGSQVYSAQKDAMYMATLKAVVNYKINDEDIIDDVNSLRQNQRFLQQLQGMLNKLSNRRSSDSKNRQIERILERAGKDIYDILK